MANQHCYNCFTARNCRNYYSDVCAYKGDSDFGETPVEFENRYCATSCFVCKYEDKCVATCKGEECSECRFLDRVCPGQEKVTEKLPKISENH